LRLIGRGSSINDVISILLLTLIFSVFWVGFVGIPARAESLGSQWILTTSYPMAVIDSSCVSDSGYIYCVGGTGGLYPHNTMFNSVYYAQLSSSGVGLWTPTTDYPTTNASNCVVNSGYIYCFAGMAGSNLTAVYYARLSSSGVGQWVSTVSYPTSVSGQSCVTYAGYIYCVGPGTDYYSKLSSNGGITGAWNASTSYPSASPYGVSCASSSGYVYCVGLLFSSTPNMVYYASLSSDGVGSWTQTTNYPPPTGSQQPGVGAVCVVYSGYIYCSLYGGSSMYYARLSSSGVSSWNSTTSYQWDVQFQSCTTYSAVVYCVGGDAETTPGALSSTSDVYYAPIESTSTSSSGTLTFVAGGVAVVAVVVAVGYLLLRRRP
jgi:hypothetical protein